jgi:hypothetical protein
MTFCDTEVDSRHEVRRFCTRDGLGLRPVWDKAAVDRDRGKRSRERQASA